VASFTCWNGGVLVIAALQQHDERRGADVDDPAGHVDDLESFQQVPPVVLQDGAESRNPTMHGPLGIGRAHAVPLSVSRDGARKRGWPDHPNRMGNRQNRIKGRVERPGPRATPSSRTDQRSPSAGLTAVAAVAAVTPIPGAVLAQGAEC